MKAYVILRDEAVKVKEVEFLTQVSDVQIEFDSVAATTGFIAANWQTLLTALVALFGSLVVLLVGYLGYQATTKRRP